MNMNYSLTDPTFSLTSSGTATLFSRWYLRAACRVTGRRREWQGPLRFLPNSLFAGFSIREVWDYLQYV